VEEMVEEEVVEEVVAAMGYENDDGHALGACTVVPVATSHEAGNSTN